MVVWTMDDEAFFAALRALNRSDDWKRVAIAGRTVAVFDAQFAGSRNVDRTHTRPAEERRAWLWGYDWKEGAPPPEERPEGACPECWRLGEPCDAHFVPQGARS